MRIQKVYDNEFKKNAVKLAEDIGVSKAVKELGVPSTTIYGWIRKNNAGEIDLIPEKAKPKISLKLSEEVTLLKQQVRKQEMELREKERTIEILKEASIFFAKSQKK